MAHVFADGSGGALFNIGQLKIINTVFSENVAAEGGLAIMNHEPLLDTWNVSFHGNKLTCNPDEYNDFNHVRTAHELVCTLMFNSMLDMLSLYTYS